MAGTMFMRVEELAKEMGVSIPYAYKLIRKLNEEWNFVAGIADTFREMKQV